MARRHCLYIVKPRNLIDDENIPDRIYRAYDKLLAMAWEETGAQYEFVMLSNAELAQDFHMTEDGARDIISEMRKLKLITTEQVGRTGRRIRLLVAHRPGKDSRAELNAPRETEANWEAPVTAAQDVDTTDCDFEGATVGRSLEDDPNSTNIPSFNNKLKENISTSAQAQKIWKTALAELALQMTKATFDTWVRASRAVDHRDGILYVQVHSPYAKDWLENRLDTTIRRTVTGIVGSSTEVRYVLPEIIPSAGKE